MHYEVLMLFIIIIIIIIVLLALLKANVSLRCSVCCCIWTKSFCSSRQRWLCMCLCV